MSIPKIESYPLNDLIRKVAPNKVSWQLDKDRAVLLIHDMQEYFIRFYGEDSTLVRELINNIRKVKAWCTANSIPVVYTAQPPDQRVEDRALLTDFWGPGLTSGKNLECIFGELAPDAQDTVLTKWRYSAFQRTALHQLMHEDKRDQLIIVGVYTHIGILSTALEGFMTDIQPFVISDATADFSLEQHLMGLDYIAGRCGVVTTTEFVTEGEASNELSANPVITLTSMISDVSNILGLDESIDPQEELMDYGLDSIRLMKLVDQWQKGPISFGFEDIAHCATLQQMYEAIQDKNTSGSVTEVAQ